jgi:hypothetical protein
MVNESLMLTSKKRPRAAIVCAVWGQGSTIVICMD